MQRLDSGSRPWLWSLVLFSTAAFTFGADLPVPNRGILRLELPGAWKEEKRTTPEGLPPTIEMLRSANPRGSLQVTVMWSPKDDPEFAREKNLRELALAGQKVILPTIVEQELPLQPIQGAKGIGFYYSATDKNYKPTNGALDPNDMPILTHGELGAGSFVLSFTILSDAKDDVAVNEALVAMRNAVINPTSAISASGDRLQELLNRAGIAGNPVAEEEGSFHAEILYDMNFDFFSKVGGRSKKAVAVSRKVTVFYLYEFQTPERTNIAAAYAAGSLWGESGPTREHSDELLLSGSQLLVISGGNPDKTARLFENLGFRRYREKKRLPCNIKSSSSHDPLRRLGM